MDITQLAPLISLAHRRQLNDDELETINHYFISKKLSGLDALLGLRYTKAGPEGIEAEMTIEKHHLQPAGFVNGGVFCSIGESVASISGFIATDAKAQIMGMNNSTDFLRPGTVGMTVTATSHAVHLGRTTQIWDVDMRDKESGKLLARTRLRTTVMSFGG